MKLDYFTTTPPWPATTGANLRVNAIYEALRHHHLDVRLVVLGERPDEATRDTICHSGGCVYSNRSDAPPAKLLRYLWAAAVGRDPVVGHFLDEAGLDQFGRLVAERHPELILLGNVYLAPLIPKLRDVLPESRIILDNHNVESLLHRRIQARGRSLRVQLPAAIVARASQRLEREYLERAHQVWACSGVDADHFRQSHRLSKVFVIPNAVDTESFAYSGEAEGRNITFTGTLWYPPSAEAARLLIETSRRLRARGVKHTLYLVGQGPKRELLRQAQSNPNVVLTGSVPDVRPFLAKAAVVAVPLRAGSGTKLKLLQAMSMGKAIVTTTIGAEGLMLTDGVDAIVSDDPEEFDEQLIRLLNDPRERARLGAAARAHAVKHFSLEMLTRRVGDALREMPPPSAEFQAPALASSSG
jgi:glycosyltransferase involved in cell wall biosynthesis